MCFFCREYHVYSYHSLEFLYVVSQGLKIRDNISTDKSLRHLLVDPLVFAWSSGVWPVRIAQESKITFRLNRIKLNEIKFVFVYLPSQKEWLIPWSSPGKCSCSDSILWMTCGNFSFNQACKLLFGIMEITQEILEYNFAWVKGDYFFQMIPRISG